MRKARERRKRVRTGWTKVAGDLFHRLIRLGARRRRSLMRGWGVGEERDRMHSGVSEETAFRREFERRQQRQARFVTVMALCSGGVLLLSALARARAVGARPLLVGIPLLVGAVAFVATQAWRNWRCPRCAAPLVGNWRALSCRRCGLLFL